MSRRAIVVALFGVLAVAACGDTVTAPALADAAGTAVVAKRKTAQCSDYRPIVAQLVSLVERRTSGDVRATLLADLQGAYAALDPAGCDARLATSYLQKFVVDVQANGSSISDALETTLVALAQAVIGYLAPFVV